MSKRVRHSWLAFRGFERLGEVVLILLAFCACPGCGATLGQPTIGALPRRESRPDSLSSKSFIILRFFAVT